MSVVLSDQKKCKIQSNTIKIRLIVPSNIKAIDLKLEKLNKRIWTNLGYSADFCTFSGTSYQMIESFSFFSRCYMMDIFMFNNENYLLDYREYSLFRIIHENWIQWVPVAKW